MVCKNVTADYAEQVVSEVKVAVTDRRTGAITYEWRPVSQHADNHYLDCEVYATLAARVLGMHVVADDEEEAAATAKYSPPPKQRSGWMQRGR
jgi:phage terminase large subunit GpA-like protein